MKKILFILLLGLVLGCAGETTPKPEPTPTPKLELTSIPRPELTSIPRPEPTSTPKPELTSIPKSESTSTSKLELTSISKPESTSTPKLEPTVIPTVVVNNIKSEPPFVGTVFLSPDILTSSDPSSFEILVKVNDEQRKMYDRRYGWVNIKPFLFHAEFSDGLIIEVQVNPEFETKEIAEDVALQYLPAVGQLPTYLRKDIDTIWLHNDVADFGGGNNNLLIYHARGLEYKEQEILEEIFLHEATHTSLDSYHLSSPEWITAQEYDGQYISNYARDNPEREDLAETFPLCFALKYKSSVLSEDVIQTIKETIPNRLIYCDVVFFDGSGY